jgi:hypothetical protein
MPDYVLIDAEDLATKLPLHFEIPSTADRENLPDHADVKLGFMTGHKNGVVVEHVYVRVFCKEADADIYYGKVHDDPAIVGLDNGDEIQFSSKNIFGIIG